jgi:hypothetical protein
MRELHISDLRLISGGSTGDALAVGGALGGGVGISIGMSSGASGTAVLGLGGIGAGVGAALVGAGAVGIGIGNLLNEHTPIQQVIQDLLPDPSGLSYCGGGY